MGFDAWLTLGVLVVVLIALIYNLIPSDLLFLGATAFLAVFGVITVDEAFAGFANAGMLTVGVLFVVAAGLRDTGVLDFIRHHVLGEAQTEKQVLARLAAVTVPLSAFLNNTPIVAMFMPVLLDWSRQHRVSPSKLLIPLSYFAILGGTVTLIGTSTNLVVHGLMLQNGVPGMGLFEIGRIGVIYAIVGVAYIYFAGPKLLPVRKELFEQFSETQREYLAEMQVMPGCRLIGQTAEHAGARYLPGLFLVEIERNGRLIGPVRPSDIINVDDRLVLAGPIESIIDLDKLPGLVPVVDPSYDISNKQGRDRRLCEAVISENSNLLGKTIREADFGAFYGAAVVAVHRRGKRVEKKIADIVLQTGDTLLLQVRPHFLRAHRHDPAFYLISGLDDWRPVHRDRAWVAGALFLILLVLMTTGWIPTLLAATLIALLMVITGCVSSGDAQQSVEWQVLVTIAAAFGLGTALQNSGAATAIAGSLVSVTVAWGPIAALAAIYLIGSIITEVITNNAAAVLLFPFCLETARLYGVEPRPFLMALTLAASASFMTPIGYQTNLMVYGPGGYRFSDFFRIGAPLNFILLIVAVVFIPLLWSF